MTPTQTVLAAATAPLVVTDGTNRRLVVKRLTALDTLRLFKAAGPVLAHNQAWLSMAMLAVAVIEVDDLDAALEWAAGHPDAEWASVEIRPLVPWQPPPGVAG